MATITLTLDDEVLAALVRGEATKLTATLKVTKPRKSQPVYSPDEQLLHKELTESWIRDQPNIAVARLWKAVKGLKRSLDEIGPALECALDWNKGRDYPPEWFAKDYTQWEERAFLDPFAMEDARTDYRRRLGLN